RHSPRFLTYRADVANFCRFVCAKGALYKIIRRTNNRATVEMPPEDGFRVRSLPQGGISLPIPDFQIIPCARRTNDMEFLQAGKSWATREAERYRKRMRSTPGSGAAHIFKAADFMINRRLVSFEGNIDGYNGLFG
ncbi:hypothetical protein ACEL71_001192, partial [Neisseria gonorrhoeae]